jgi:hypothetical protein
MKLLNLRIKSKGEDYCTFFKKMLENKTGNIPGKLHKTFPTKVKVR